MSDLKRACDHLEVGEEQVVSHGYEGDVIVLLVDHGIGGVKRHRVPAADLEPEPGGELGDLGYRELQSLAKAHGIAANQSAEDLIAELEGAIAPDEEPLGEEE